MLLLISGKDSLKKPILDIWIYSIRNNNWSIIQNEENNSINSTLPMLSYFVEDTVFVIFANNDRNKMNLVNFNIVKVQKKNKVDSQFERPVDQVTQNQISETQEDIPKSLPELNTNGKNIEVIKQTQDCGSMVNMDCDNTNTIDKPNIVNNKVEINIDKKDLDLIDLNSERKVISDQKEKQKQQLLYTSDNDSLIISENYDIENYENEAMDIENNENEKIGHVTGTCDENKIIDMDINSNNLNKSDYIDKIDDLVYPKPLSDTSSNISEPRSLKSSKSKSSNLSKEISGKVSEESKICLLNQITKIKPYKKVFKQDDLQNRKICIDQSTDTSDLIPSIDILKTYFTNHLITWSFIEKMSDYYQWPLACIGNLVDNSIKKSNEHGVTVLIDYFMIDLTQSTQPKVQKEIQSNLENEDFYQNKINFTNGTKPKLFPILTIKDDGSGISKRKFNKLVCLNSTNELKENKFFEFGFTFRSSLMRLADSVLIISNKKKYHEISVGLMSKTLQNLATLDYLINPVINFRFDPKTKNLVPTSIYYNEILCIILNEIQFIFPNAESFLDYIRHTNTGTHLFLYNLKCMNKTAYNTEPTYEITSCEDTKDILFNYFNIQVGLPGYIDSSLKTYLRYSYLKHSQRNKIFILKERVNLQNPLYTISNIATNFNDIKKINKIRLDSKQSKILY